MLCEFVRGIGCALVVSLAVLVWLPETGLCQVVPSNRLTIWQGNVGVAGGIPNRTTIYTTIPAGASGATIQNAINACPSNQVVLLSAGTYTITSTLNLNSYMTLRGAGMNSTVLLGTNISPVVQIANPVSWDWSSPVPANHVSWIGNYTQGTNTLIVASTNLAGSPVSVPVGRLIFIDQLNDTNTSAIGTYGTATPGGYTSIAQPNTGLDRYQSQLTKVIAVNGQSVTISPGIFMPNYSPALLPQIWWESANPIEQAGVENLWIVVSNVDNYAIFYYNAHNCWGENVRTTAARRHHAFWQAVNCQVEHCYLETDSGSGDDYPLAIFNSSAGLIENNVINGIQNGLVCCGMSGSVFAYNYITNCLSANNWMWCGIYLHGAHPSMNLFEGNVAPGIAMDNGWGSSIYNTALRNRFIGEDESNPNTSGFTQAVDVGATNRFENIVGNVLGTVGKDTAYESYAQTSGCNDGGRIYYIAYLYSSCSTPWDPVTYSSMIRAYNWDSANQGVVAGGYQASDVPNSYYLTGRPAFFGSLPWPPVDPDNPTYSSSRTNIPAAYRFVFGVDPPGASTSQPPVAVSSASPLAGAAPLAVAFSSAGSYSPQGAALTYSWTFGDGATSTAANPGHTYQSAGTYPAQLSVSDGTNTTPSSILSIQAMTNPPAPTALRVVQ
jgi:hypothetical protein